MHGVCFLQRPAIVFDCPAAMVRLPFTALGCRRTELDDERLHDELAGAAP